MNIPAISFGTRLTISYAVLTGILLAIVAVGLTALAFEMAIHPTVFAINDVTASTDAVVKQHWTENDAQLIARVMRQPARSTVEIVVHSNPADRPPGPPPGGTLAIRSVGWFLGLRPRIIPLHGGEVFIGPNLPQIEGLLRIYLGALGAALSLTLVSSCALGRWITQQALAPLTTVTRELRRFAEGDFRPGVLANGDRGELGALVAAYNGAAAQVSAAFCERERNDQRLRSILGEAGHEMRTPLTVISASIELLDTHTTGSPENRARALAMLRGETRRLRELVERVMALARLDGSDRSSAEVVDLVAAVEDTIAEVVSATGGDVRLHAGSEDMIVYGEPWEVHEAVGNLVDNAVKYGGGSTVHVAIGAEGERIAVRVSNEGPGIATEDRERIFRHFFRGAQGVSAPGSGLGLAIVARAAQRLGGEVVLERSGPPETTFRLALPAYRAARRGSVTARLSATA